MSERNLRKTRVGRVVSDKMDKTIVVSVEDIVRHPLYNKTIKRTSKIKAHDEHNECRIGDKVLVMETRPLSRQRRRRAASSVEDIRRYHRIGSSFGRTKASPAGVHTN